MSTSFQENDCYDFSKLIAHSEKDDIGKETWIAPFKDLTLETDFDRVVNGWKYELIWHGGHLVRRAVFTPFAFNGYARTLKCPAKFLLTLPGNLAKGNMDYFKEDLRDKDIAIKIKHRTDAQHPEGGFNYIRGVVSPSAALISNTELLKAMQPEAEKHGMRVWKAHFRPQDFHAKLIWGGDVNIGSMQSPDNVNIGIHVSNSDVGARPLEIQMMIFRLVCTNGMIHMVDGVPLFRRKAVNMSRDELKAQIGNALHTLSIRSDHLIGKFQDARCETIKKPFAVISRISKKYNLGKSQVVGVVEEYNRGIATGEYTDNRISVVNALTKYAQQLDQNTRVKLETVAGKFLFDDEILENAVEAGKKEESLDNSGL
jgi:hypothetical protein